MVRPGDTVEWVYASGSHTVTNGTGAADPLVSNLFDMPLNNSNTTASYTFDQEGDYDYFCRPHEGLGMKGVVSVVAPPSFVKIGTITSLPDPLDCMDADHQGRLIVGTADDAIFVCTGGGWKIVAAETLP